MEFKKFVRILLVMEYKLGYVDWLKLKNQQTYDIEVLCSCHQHKENVVLIHSIIVSL